MPLKDLPAAQRPRERLLAHGPQALADAELLALLLRSGLPGQDVLSLAQLLLDRFGGWPGLLAAPPGALAQVKGLGPAKQAELAAVMEIARRSLHAQLQQRPLMADHQVLHDWLRSHLGTLEHEALWALFVDTQLRLIAAEPMFRGSLRGTEVHPRELAKRALALNAAGLFIAHNHPSGNAEPSSADEWVTGRIRDALALLDVRLHDHFIVAGNTIVSLAQRGLV
jgi:DNA repair protein RadC